MTKNLILFVLIIGLVITSCHKENQGQNIYVKNNSSEAIYYLESFSFPDSTLKGNEIEKPGEGDKIKPSEEGAIIAGRGVFGLNATFQVFIFSADTIEKEPWDTIVAQYKILKRYQFTETDLETSNWTVTYP
ncbi:MAG: hypothetical protein ABI723_05665 [Bacteroidia bacterium]